MGRRWGWLGALAALAALWASCGHGAEPVVRDRVLIYYLPYDNDLSVHADAVLTQLERAIPSDRVAVVALVDRAGDGGLERHVMTRAGRAVDYLDGERSSDANVLRDLLDHASETLPAHRYALFMLGHGGAEDRWAYDASEPFEERWMALSDAARAARAFRARPEIELDLVFLQQCGRAAMTTLAGFAGAADVVMASQTVVGAPNHYYGGVLGQLAVDPAADGETLARLIMNHESPAMYADYVAFRGDALDELPRRVDAVLSPLFARSELAPAGAAGSVAPTITYRYADEVHVDLVQWLDGMHRANGVDPAPVDELRRWLIEEAIVDRRVSPPHERLGRDLCGVNVPLSA